MTKISVGPLYNLWTGLHRQYLDSLLCVVNIELSVVKALINMGRGLSEDWAKLPCQKHFIKQDIWNTSTTEAHGTHASMHNCTTLIFIYSHYTSFLSLSNNIWWWCVIMSLFVCLSALLSGINLDWVVQHNASDQYNRICCTCLTHM